MSQLADVEDVVRSTPLTSEQQGKLFFELLQALGWEVDGVYNQHDAEIYLFGLKDQP